MEIKLKELRAEYEKAKNNKLKHFSFKGLKFVTNYAKYMIQFCESQGVCDNDYLNLIPTEEIK
jgi:hypothetical protein